MAAKFKSYNMADGYSKEWLEAAEKDLSIINTILSGYFAWSQMAKFLSEQLEPMNVEHVIDSICVVDGAASDEIASLLKLIGHDITDMTATP